MVKKRNQGQVMVFMALAILFLMGMAALAVDVGYMYSTRNELQRCADAGALAGASRFIEPGSAWSSNPSDPVMVQADARARVYAATDTVVSSPLDPNAEVTVGFPSQDRIRVTTQRTVPLFFARVLGRTNQQITATAVAEASIADTGVKCLKPWGIPIPWEDSDGDGTYDPGENVPDDGMNSVPPGTQMILKIAEPFNKNGQLDLPSLQQEAGHFFAIALCGDRGGSDYRNRIMNPCDPDCSISLDESIPVEPGNMVGPTKQAVAELLGWPGTWNPTTNAVDGSGFDDFRDSPRFVQIPVYNPEDLLSSGRIDMTVAGFAGFWLDGFDSKQGTVTGYYVPDIAGGGASGTGPAPGPVLRTLRLVE